MSLCDLKKLYGYRRLSEKRILALKNKGEFLIDTGINISARCAICEDKTKCIDCSVFKDISAINEERDIVMFRLKEAVENGIQVNR
jgi:hypothetical protein